MPTLRAWIRRLYCLLRGARRERELAAELEAHFQLHIDDNIRRGMSPQDARREAVLKFGPVEAIKDEYRDRAGVPLAEIVVQDVRYGLRRMGRRPGFTALIALTLALGVGANAAMFGLVDVLMFRTPALLPHPERIVAVRGVESYVRYQILRERLQAVELAAYTRQTLGFGSGVDAVPVRTECVTPSYLPMLRVLPQWGRSFTASDGALGAGRTIILSHSFWTRHFDADSRALGMSVVVAGRQYEIIGIARRGFTGVELADVDAWILIEASPEECSPIGRNLLRSESNWLTTVGRLGDGFSMARAQAELASIDGDRAVMIDALGRRIDRAAQLAPLYASRRVNLTRDSRLALWLAGGAAVLFLLACANVAGLLWTHTLDRGREIAVRLQLGAGRSRVFAQLLMEHLLIAVVGGAAAVVTSIWISEALRTYFAADVDAINGRTVAVVASLALAAGLLSGVVPAFQASKAGSACFLRTGTALMGSRSRLRTALLSLQVGLALVLVTAAGLFIGSVDSFRRDFAYDLNRVIVVSIDFQKSAIRSPRDVQAIFESLRDHVRRLPAVASSALSSAPVLGSGGPSMVIAVGRSSGAGTTDFHSLAGVSSEYFEALGLRLLAGRAFTPLDRNGGALVLNEALARDLFPGEDPIGKCVFVGNRCVDVVGISEPFRTTVKSGRGGQAQSQIFVPLGDGGDSHLVPQILLIRTHQPAAGEVATVATALRAVAPDLPYVNVRTLDELADTQARSWLLGASVFSLFGTLAVVLAGVGIYGALAFSIRQRTVEMGVRMALGAMRVDIARMVLRHGALVVAFGLTLGIAGALAASRFVQSLLFNVAASDPIIFALACLVVVGAALLGCVIPAIRAMRIDPAVALRYD